MKAKEGKRRVSSDETELSFFVPETDQSRISLKENRQKRSRDEKIFARDRGCERNPRSRGVREVWGDGGTREGGSASRGHAASASSRRVSASKGDDDAETVWESQRSGTGLHR